MLSSALRPKFPLPSDCALSPTEHLFEFFWPQLTHVTCGSSEGQHEPISPLARRSAQAVPCSRRQSAGRRLGLLARLIHLDGVLTQLVKYFPLTETPLQQHYRRRESLFNFEPRVSTVEP